MIFDQSGALASTKRHDYLPFGEEVFNGARTAGMGYGGGDNIRQKFTKYEHDNETGLEYARARYYSSSMERYTGVDPITVTPERFFDPQQFNLYAYTRNNPLRLVDPTGERLTASGDLVEIEKQLADMLGTEDAAKRITFDEKTNTVTVDLTGIDLSQNAGASLLNDVIGSNNVYDVHVGSSVETLGGQLSLSPSGQNTKTMANLDNNVDETQYRTGKTDKDKPKKGVDDQVAINYAYRDQHTESLTTLKLAPNWTTTFHELAEAYAKVEHGKRYAEAHQEAVDRESLLRDQRPYLKGYNPGSGPGTSLDTTRIIIRNPK
jgi:RHS repeat-associated protein